MKQVHEAFARSKRPTPVVGWVYAPMWGDVLVIATPSHPEGWEVSILFEECGKICGQNHYLIKKKEVSLSDIKSILFKERVGEGDPPSYEKTIYLSNEHWREVEKVVEEEGLSW